MDATAKNTAPDTTKQPPEPDPKNFGQTRPNDPNPKAVDHAMINQGANKNSESMKDIGLVSEPVVSVHPTSLSTPDWPKDDYKIIDNANMYLRDDRLRDKQQYPFRELKAGQGFFVPVKPGGTTDDLIGDLNRVS